MLVNYLIFPYDNVGIAVSTYLNKKPHTNQSWTGLHRARISTILTQCGIILTENGTKRQPTTKEELWVSFKKPAELFSKTT